MKRLSPMLRHLPLAAACIAGPAQAPNGYFSHGYRIKAKRKG